MRISPTASSQKAQSAARRVVPAPGCVPPGVEQTAKCDERGEADEGQVRVADDPVAEVDQAVHGHDRLDRPLQPDDQVRNDAEPDEPGAARRRRPSHSVGAAKAAGLPLPRSPRC